MQDMTRREVASYHTLAVETKSEHRTLKKEWETHGSWETALRRRGKNAVETAIQTFKKLEAGGIRLVLANDPDFPEALRHIPWPPFGVYVRGAPLNPKEVCVAIVGTRRATPQGKRFAETIAGSLGEAGLTVVSGLALGIDAAAQGAVAARGLRTIAVLAGGVNTIYPRENERVGQQILDAGGSLVSEYPPGTPPLPHRFIERNRIVAGLSQGVVVIEAPSSSGSLATANFAIEQNREVFVVPGFPDHPNYAGSHALIKSGASLITGAEDVLEALGIDPKNSGCAATEILASLDASEKAIINVLTTSGVPMGAPAIADRAELNPAEAGASLGALVVKGILNDRLGSFTVAEKKKKFR